MAKHKSTKCSTGHGTGVTPHVELREVLRRDRHQFLAKRYARVGKKVRRAKARNASPTNTAAKIGLLGRLKRALGLA